MAYLSSLPVEDKEEEGFDPIPNPRDLVDFQDVVLSLAVRWRENDFSADFFRRLRFLESELAQTIRKTCAEHSHPDSEIVVDICCVLSYLWAQEYLFREVIPVRIEEVAPFKGESPFTDWIHQQRERMKLTHLNMQQPLLKASLSPGELERHARMNAGVFAADSFTAIEETRPYVAHKALLEACVNLDLSLGGGILVAHLVNRYLTSTFKFPWVKHNVFLDTEFMSHDKHADVKHRTQPWMILVGARWHIICGEQTWWTHSPYRAVLKWFNLLYQTDPVFYMMLEEWDLSNCVFSEWSQG